MLPLVFLFYETSSQTYCLPMKINQLWFVDSFISAPWTLSCIFVCLCSSLSSQLPWLLVAHSPNRRWKSSSRRTSGFRKIRISSVQRRRMTSSPVALKPHSISRFWRWDSTGIGDDCLSNAQGRSTSQPPRDSAPKLFCKTFYSMSLWYPPSCSREKQMAPQKYLALEEKLRKDPRLAEHLSHAWFLYSFTADTGNQCWSLLEAAWKKMWRSFPTWLQ